MFAKSPVGMTDKRTLTLQFSLLFSISLLFFFFSFSDFPCFFVRFSSLFQGFEGFREEKNPCFFRCFPCFFFLRKKSKDWRGQGFTDRLKKCWGCDLTHSHRPPAPLRQAPGATPSTGADFESILAVFDHNRPKTVENVQKRPKIDPEIGS